MDTLTTRQNPIHDKILLTGYGVHKPSSLLEKMTVDDRASLVGFIYNLCFFSVIKSSSIHQCFSNIYGNVKIPLTNVINVHIIKFGKYTKCSLKDLKSMGRAELENV